MTKSIHLLLLATCSMALAQTKFSDTRTIDHKLWEDPVILVNSQGWAQHDLSIRGSGYTGAGISINGLNLKSPYSSHFNSELPLPASLFTHPQVRTGLDNISGHLVGTAGYDTVPQASRLQAEVGVGTKEHYKASLSGHTGTVGGFLDAEKARQIDYDANDLDRYSGGAHLQLFKNDWLIDFMGGHQQKEFGAQGYYGLPADTVAEERTEDSLLFFGATRGDLDDSYLRTSAAWRQFDDEYHIPADGFNNDVRSLFGAVSIDGRTIEIQNISLSLRGDLETEQIDGDIGDHDRTRASVLILPKVSYERFSISAGLNSVFQTSESAEWLPQAGADWFLTDNSTVYASYSENVQQPDYQTLYYADPYRTGNPLLQQQQSQNTELGFRQFVSASLDWRAAGFYRRLENASDWVANVATDLGTLNMGGLESEISYYPSEKLDLRAYYQWAHKDTDVTDGLYETDYPEHLLNFTGQWSFSPEFLLFAAQTLRYQTDNDGRTSSNFGAEASVGLHYLPRFANNARLSIMVDNLWDTDFQAIAGLKPPGRTVFTGITVGW